MGGGEMSTFPYMALAKARGLNYGEVLRASDWLEDPTNLTKWEAAQRVADEDLRAIDEVHTAEICRREGCG